MVKHSHTHGTVDATIVSTSRGIWAVKWSFIALIITGLLQLIVVFYSGSVALLADTIHNFGDAATSIPLWIAFLLIRLKPNKKFTYGYGKVEDIAGVIIVCIILTSAIIAGYETFNRLLHPQSIKLLWAVIIASIIGFLGNEAVALFRIKVGKEIHSAALIVDGYHARADGYTSLAVLFSTIGVWLGFPLADSIVGFIITIAILKLVLEAGKSVFSRLLDGVDPKIIDEIKHIALHVNGVKKITETRARWIGHQMHVELNVAVSSSLSVGEGHIITSKISQELLGKLPYLANATIHLDPINFAGEKYHIFHNHKS